MVNFSLSQINENTLLIHFDIPESETLIQLIGLIRDRIYFELSFLIFDLVPSYTTLLVVFDDEKTTYKELYQHIQNIITQQTPRNPEPNTGNFNTFQIPVYYDQTTGPDLATIAEQKHISISELIEYHHTKTYTVFAVGFTIGFPYLGEVHKAIATPRKQTARILISPGSVGIAGTQTGIYPSATPGGWNIIGRTPLNIIDYNNLNLCLIRTGDHITFYPVTKTEYQKLQGAPLTISSQHSLQP